MPKHTLLLFAAVFAAALALPETDLIVPEEDPANVLFSLELDPADPSEGQAGCGPDAPCKSVGPSTEFDDDASTKKEDAIVPEAQAYLLETEGQLYKEITKPPNKRCKEGKHHAMHCNLKCCEDACTARKDCNFAIYFSDDGCQLAPTCNALTDAYKHKGVTEKIFEKQQEAATEAAAAKEAAEEEAAAKEAAEEKRKEEEAAAKALEEKRLKEEADAKAKQEADDKAAAEKATAAKKAEDEANAKLAAEEARIRRAAEAAAAKKAEEAAASVNCDTLLEQCLWMKDNSEYPQFEQMYCYLDGDTKYGGPRPCCTAVIKEKLGDKCTWPSQNK